MTTIKIKVKINIEDIIEIDADDLMHQSIDDYMEDLISEPTDYIDIHNGIEWELV